MSLADCLNEAVKASELSQDEANRLSELYDALVRERAADGADAALRAREELVARLGADKAHQRYKLAMTIRAMDRIEADLKARDRQKKNPDIADGALDLLDHTGTSPFQSADGLRKAIVGQAHARIEGLLHAFRKNAVLGDGLSIGKKRFNFRRGKAQLDNVVRELFGQKTGDDAARGMAEAWSETAEWLRRRFNAAGGAIGKLENWGLPQSHNALALRRAGRDAWKNTIRPLLDVERMVYPLTGTRVLPEELDEALNAVFDAVTTDGWFKQEPQRAPAGKGAFANQHAEHRFLVFKDADSWLAYQRDFGEGDPFAAMMGHVNMMARDIAHMERLGPNPNATIEWLKQSIRKEASNAENGKPARWRGGAGNAANRGRKKTKKLESMWDDMRGALNAPVDSRFADSMDGVRNFVTSSILGQAALSAIGDVGTVAMAKYFSGLPMTGTIREIVGQFRRMPRRDAVAAGLILDNAMHAFGQQARYVGALAGPQWTQYLSDRVMTWQGLSPWTQASRHAYGQAHQRMVVNARDLEFSALPAPYRQQLERWGFSPKDWDGLRKVKPHKGAGGAEFLRPRDVAAVDQRLADKYLEMILQDTEHAVPSSTVRSRAFLTGAGERGTFFGEIQRSFLMFKSFGAAFGVLNTLRVLDAVSSEGTLLARGGRYAGGLAISLILLGALSIQLKQIAAGRDPRDMTTGSFWGAAGLQGGGLGLYGDFLFADVNRYGGGFATSLGGPAIEHLWDAWTLTGGNLIELAQGKTWEETRAGREFVTFLRGNTPGGTIWAAKLGYERLFLDQLQYLVDPEANRAFKRRQQFWEREFEQEFWWQPGRTTPDRAPEFGAAVR